MYFSVKPYFAHLPIQEKFLEILNSNPYHRTITNQRLLLRVRSKLTSHFDEPIHPARAPQHLKM